MRPDNLEKLKQVFAVVFELDVGSEPSDVLRFSYAEWDSLRHMSLVAALEGEFSLSLAANEVENIESFSDAETILSEKGL